MRLRVVRKVRDLTVLRACPPGAPWACAAWAATLSSRSSRGRVAAAPVPTPDCLWGGSFEMTPRSPLGGDVGLWGLPGWTPVTARLPRPPSCLGPERHRQPGRAGGGNGGSVGLPPALGLRASVSQTGGLGRTEFCRGSLSSLTLQGPYLLAHLKLLSENFGHSPRAWISICV